MGPLRHLKDKIFFFWSLCCRGTPTWCLARSHDRLGRCRDAKPRDAHLYAARRWEAGWEYFTFLERRIC